MPTLRHHIISLIQHKHLNPLDINNPPLEPIHHLSRSTNHHMSIQLGSPFNILPRQCQTNLQPSHMSRHGSHGILKNLHRQLPRGCNTQRLTRRGRINLNTIQHSQNEGGSLSRTRLSLADNITGRACQYTRKSLLLNGRGAFKSHFKEGLEEKVWEFELLECFGGVEVGVLVVLDDAKALVSVFLLTFQCQLLEAFGEFFRGLLFLFGNFLFFVEFGLGYGGGVCFLLCLFGGSGGV
mmetsp:Transcript_8354/g.18709  ORF Transcript_8354/g.18709 Transcript_8354/m.18709 type:complete len:238 (-) Transcript_8354:289-1002(-)